MIFAPLKWRNSSRFPQVSRSQSLVKKGSDERLNYLRIAVRQSERLQAQIVERHGQLALRRGSARLASDPAGSSPVISRMPTRYVK